MDRARVSRYLWGWGVRFVTNFVRLSLLTSMAGYFMFALIFLALVVTNNQEPVSPVAHGVATLAKSFNVMLAGVTGGGDFEGGILEIGEIAIAFLAPYLLGFNLLLSLAETLVGRSLIGWLAWPLKRQLQGVGCLWLLFSVVAIFQSVVPPEDVPYWLRVVIFGMLFGFLAFQVVLLWATSVACDRLIRATLRH